MKHTHDHHDPPADDPHASHHHGFDDPSAFAQRFDAPERDAWQKPEEVIASFHLPTDATVAEIGAGTGYFVVRLARHLSNGTVIGLDAEPKMVEYLRHRAAGLGLTNVDARLVRPADAIPLTEQLDLLLCVDAYHHMSERVSLFSNYREHLKDGGNLVIIDRAADAPDGPPAEYRLSTKTVKEELTAAGFTVVADKDFLLPHQNFLVFRPTTSKA